MTHEDEKELAALREQEAALAMKAKGARSPHVGRCHERRLARVQHFSSNIVSHNSLKCNLFRPPLSRA